MAGRKGGPKKGKGGGIDPSLSSPIDEAEKVPETVNIETKTGMAKAEKNKPTPMVTIKVSRVGLGLVDLKRASRGKVPVGHVLIDGVDMEPGGKYRVPQTETILKLARSKTVHILR